MMYGQCPHLPPTRRLDTVDAVRNALESADRRVWKPQIPINDIISSMTDETIQEFMIRASDAPPITIEDYIGFYINHRPTRHSGPQSSESSILNTVTIPTNMMRPLDLQLTSAWMSDTNIDESQHQHVFHSVTARKYTDDIYASTRKFRARILQQYSIVEERIHGGRDGTQLVKAAGRFVE